MIKPELEHALEKCNREILSNPNLAQAYLSRGEIFETMEQAEKAIGDFQTALRLAPDSQAAWKQLLRLEAILEEKFMESEAKSLLDQALDAAYNDEPEIALEACEQARALLPPIAHAYNYLGLILEFLDQMEPAIDAYRRATELNPRFSAAWQNLSNATARAEEGLYLQEGEFLPEPEDVGQAITESELLEHHAPDGPVLQWLYMDATAYHVTGWPGNRTRQGRSGYDPLDANAESGYGAAKIIQLSWRHKLRTQNLFYLFFMTLAGLYLTLPFLIFAIAIKDFLAVLATLAISSPYWILGAGLLVNVQSSLWEDQPDYSKDRGDIFY